MRASTRAAMVPIATDRIATKIATIRLFHIAGQNAPSENSLRYQSRVNPVSGRLVSADWLKLNSTTSTSGTPMKAAVSKMKAASRDRAVAPRRGGSWLQPRRNSAAKQHDQRPATRPCSVKDMALPIGQLKPKENCSSMKWPIIDAPPPTKRGVT